MLKKTSENQKFCERQIERMQGTKFFNILRPGAIAELENVLMTCASSQAQAEMGVTLWLDDHSDFPTTAELRALFRHLNEASDGAIPEACDKCRLFGGRGVSVTYRVKTGVFAGEERDGIAYCDCPRGLALASADAKRKREEDREPSEAPKLERAATVPEAEELNGIFGKLPEIDSSGPVH